jgi:hypothetical protein
MPPQNQKNELVRLQSEITNEITSDAPHIARMVFGDAKDHPDVVGLPNQRIDDIYRDKYLSDDRTWLQAEARRDPEQFLKVTERIGVRMPEPQPPAPAPAVPLPAPPPVAQAPMLPPAPPVPMVPPAPVAPGPVVVPPIPAPMQAAAPPPVIYGPNGQPLSLGG